MKNLFYLLFASLFSFTSFGQIGLYHPIYSANAMPSSVSLEDSNALYVTYSNSLNSSAQYGDINYFRKSKSGKFIYGIGASTYYFNDSYSAQKFNNQIRVSGNRLLWEKENRSLKLGGNIGTVARLDLPSYKHSLNLFSSLGLSYEGQWLELTATENLMFYRENFSGFKKNFFYSNLSGFVGVKSQLKWAELRTRLTLASYLKTPIISQHFKTIKGFTFGYGLGFGYYQADIGYQFKKLAVNVGYQYSDAFPSQLNFNQFLNLGLKYNF
ncbi:MAG: hypothetical protein KJ941_02535 [Bacteroidetes bacterium]|nr:hypothetical protein [Bacteroidota bacterium]